MKKLLLALAALIATPSLAAGKPLALYLNPTSQSVIEGQSAVFSLTKSGGGGQSLIRCSTSDGSLSTSTYTATTLNVPTADNSVVDGSRNITLTCVAGTGARASATLTITDNDVAPPPPPPATAWTFCSVNNGVCNVQAPANVRYGINGVWSAPVAVTSSILCNHANFNDPVFDANKVCETDGKPGTAPLPTTLGGEAPVADTLNLNDWIIPGEATFPVAAGDVGAYRFTCLAGHVSKDDPIVFPGQPGKSHIHQFFGNTDTDAFSNYQSLRTKGGSTCTRSATESPQRSAYWMPAMLDGAGSVIKPDLMNTYYKQLPNYEPECARTVVSLTDWSAGPNVGKCVPMPNGMRFILGFNMATMTGGPNDLTSRDWQAMGFDCHVNNGGSNPGASLTGTQRTMAAIVNSGKCTVGSLFRVYLTFPQCWNGRDIDSPDHRAHIIFPPQARCPQTHPYKIPEVAVSAYFLVDANFLAGKWSLASDMPGMLPGSSLHMDYWEAWNPTIKDLWQKGCIDGGKSCSTGNLGNNTMVKGMQQIGPYPSGIKVPLP